MKLFLDYLNKIKFHILLMIFPTIFTGIIFFLYQLSPEPVLYVALLWLLAGLTACMTGFSNYRKKLQQLTLIATAPDINLSRMDTPSDQIESLQQDIMHRLNQMRMNVETAGQKSLEEMTDYYTMWAHQIKTPIFALRLLLQENPSANKEALAELFKIEQYVEIVPRYLRSEDMSSDLTLSCCSLDLVIRDQIHKYAGIFVSRKLSLTYDGISESVLTDEKWLGFVIGQILSNALKYTRADGIHIYLKDVNDSHQNSDNLSDTVISSTSTATDTATSITLIIEDTGIGIPKEKQDAVFNRFTKLDEFAKGTGLGLSICKVIAERFDGYIAVESEIGKGSRFSIILPLNPKHTESD